VLLLQSRTVVAHKFLHDHVCQFVSVISVKLATQQSVAVTQLVPFHQFHAVHGYHHSLLGVLLVDTTERFPHKLLFTKFQA
jgi:hypothetical protein